MGYNMYKYLHVNACAIFSFFDNKVFHNANFLFFLKCICCFLEKFATTDFGNPGKTLESATPGLYVKSLQFFRKMFTKCLRKIYGVEKHSKVFH